MASLLSSIERFFVKLWNPPMFQSVSFLVESLHLTRAYYVAAELGIADLVSERPRTIAELAELTDTDPDSLHRVLRTLAAFRVFREDSRGLFRMTRRARVLLREGSESRRAWLALIGSPELWQGFAKTLESVRTGIPGFELAHHAQFYDYLAAHPKLGETFSKALSSWTQWQCNELTRTYDFGRFRTVLDVGGGMGTLLAAILKAHPTSRGILVDQAATIETAKTRFEAETLAARCQFVGGSFFDPIPGQADVGILKHVLRDWDDHDAVAILRNCHHALAPNGTLLVIEAIVDPRNGADRINKLVDLELASVLRGGLRTRTQLDSLLERAGFRPLRTHATSVPDSQILESVRGVEAAPPQPTRPAMRRRLAERA
jgi:SAM-dependent methyltransferase